MKVLSLVAAVALAAAATSIQSGMAIAGTGLPTGPETIWLAQSAETTEGNAGALQMQRQLEVKLRQIGVDYPEGQFMTMDQVDRLNALFNLNEGEASTRDEAKVILGM